MKDIAISKFKATCLAVLEEVRQTGEPVRITRRGVPVAEVVPPSPPPRRKRNWGAMAGTVKITGDIIAPAADLDEWDALRD